MERQPPRRDADPFPTTADPEAYVGRAACERALAALERRVLDGTGPTALTGPPGLGKTLLLRVLAQRLAERARPAYLPYAALPPEGLAAWALVELALPPHANPEAALVAAAVDGEPGPVALLLDEAAALPLACARGLVDLCAEARGALRLVVAATDDARTGRVLAALGPQLAEVRLSEPLSGPETVAYVGRRLERAPVSPHARARFDPAALARLHRQSGGVPRTLHHLASALLLGRAARDDGALLDAEPLDGEPAVRPRGGPGSPPEPHPAPA